MGQLNEEDDVRSDRSYTKSKKMSANDPGRIAFLRAKGKEDRENSQEQEINHVPHDTRALLSSLSGLCVDEVSSKPSGLLDLLVRRVGAGRCWPNRMREGSGASFAKDARLLTVRLSPLVEVVAAEGERGLRVSLVAWGNERVSVC
jgi:hypothetical protein